MPETIDYSNGSASTVVSSTVRLTSSSYNPQYPRSAMVQASSDSDGNEQESLHQRNENKVQKCSVRPGKTSQQNQTAPLTLGGFARTLLKKAHEENVPKDEFALSPNSVRKIMFFPSCADQKSKSEIPSLAYETSKENVSPPLFSSVLESKDKLVSSPEEAESTNKSLGRTEGDSGIAHTILSVSEAVTEALDLSAGSTNKYTSHLQSIQETNESPSVTVFKHSDRTESPKKFESLKHTRSEGCININVRKESSVAYKPSPPLMQEGHLKPSAIIIKSNNYPLIPSNPTPNARAKLRKSANEIAGLDGKGPVKAKRIEKCSSLRGTPKGFDPSKLREYCDEGRDIVRSKMRGKINTAMMDWNFDTEGVQGRNYLVIKQLGKGASGEVSLVIESQSKNLFALKKVNLAGITESVIQECINEIQMLVELKDTDLVIRIQAWEINKIQQTMKIVMEYGQCDLGSSLKNSTYSLHQVRSTWESMLRIVSKIHDRGIVHSDLKPANFVWVGNHLKIIDFGIASRLQSDHTSIPMLNPKGTLNYISPETLRPDEKGNMKIGPKSDIWALGCILFLMVYGKTPFQDHTHYITKITAIANGNIIYPPLPPAFEGTRVDSVLQMCFMMDHHKRPTAAELLQHPFLPGPNVYPSSSLFKKPLFKT